MRVRAESEDDSQDSVWRTAGHDAGSAGGAAWRGCGADPSMLRLVRRLPRRERLDDVVDALGLQHDLRAVAARLARELGAELVDVHILGPFKICQSASPAASNA